MKRCYWGVFFLLSLLITGCRASGKSNKVPPTAKTDIPVLTVTCSAFRDGETIPKKYTCDGVETSPDLQWSGTPSGAKSLVLIVDDPDAPNGTWVHWVLFNIPPDLNGLPEGVIQGLTVKGIGLQGRNSSSNNGYNGPCPPKGNPHHYFFKLYALDVLLDLDPGSSKAQLEKAMTGHILAQGQLVGTYGR
jgi:hypothetical protein